MAHVNSDNHPLDRPAWHALMEKHMDIAIKGELSARYPPEYSVIATTIDSSEEAFKDLAKIVNKGEVIGLIAKRPAKDSPEWKELRESTVIQMTIDERLPVKGLDIVELEIKDIPDVVGLVEATKPGPFAKRTVELGRYIGIRSEEKLVAMAGERFRMNGYSEISAVCVLPEYRGKGYAKELSSILVNAILDQGDIPYLHVSPLNTAAVALYEKLGFTKRRDVPGWVMMRV